MLVCIRLRVRFLFAYVCLRARGDSKHARHFGVSLIDSVRRFGSMVDVCD